MADPPPSPPGGGGERAPRAPAPPSPAREEPPAAAARKTFLTSPAAHLPSRLTYVVVAGPSGVKQCFRTVKTVRRIPTLPKKIPKDSDSDPRVEPQPGPSLASAGPPGRAARKERVDRSKRHACVTCDKRFTSPGKLSQHQLSHTGELPFSCEFCDKKFNSKFKLVRHGLIHSEARAFSCATCGKTFNRKDHLNNHVRVHNPVKKVHRCERPGCRKQYTSLLSFRKHMALHSAEEGNLQCKICSKTFENQADIVYHLKVHTGSRTVKNETDKKFHCTFCERKFFTGKDVRRHLVVHTGRRDFLCQFCPQKFGRKDHLVRHMKNAHPDEPWSSSAVGTSSAPDPLSEELRDESDVFKTETAIDENVTYIDFPLSSEQLEELFKEERSSIDEPGPSGISQSISSTIELRPGQTPVSEANIIIELPAMREVKVEPPLDIVKLEDQEVELAYERELSSPVPSTSRNVMAGNLASTMHYPNMVYMMPPPPPYPQLQEDRDLSFISDVSLSVGEDLGQVLDPQHMMDPGDVESILIEQGESEEHLSSQIIDMIESGRILSQEQQTVLPTFTQAFQSAAQSPKPQPPPQ